MTMTIVTASGAMTSSSDPLVTCNFTVKIDGGNLDLGNWTSVELGGVEVACEFLEEGGNQWFSYPLPGRIKYQNIKLTRLVDHSTTQVAAWFASMSQGVTRRTGHIVAYDTEGKQMLEWTFIGAMPVRWTLPTLGIESPKAATETLEIAHEGFQ